VKKNDVLFWLWGAVALFFAVLTHFAEWAVPFHTASLAGLVGWWAFDKANEIWVERIKRVIEQEKTKQGWTTSSDRLNALQKQLLGYSDD
jgi:hypothetical protein